MESLRKYLGYIVFGLFLAAFVFGVISKFTINWQMLFDLFKQGIEGVITFFASWLFELVFWFIGAIAALIGLIKLSGWDAPTTENKLCKLLVFPALATFLSELGLLIVYMKIHQMGLFAGANWVALIISALVIVALIVRRVSFASKLAGRIIAAVCHLLMFITVCMFFGFGASGLAAVTLVLFLLAYVGGICLHLLISPLK